LIDILTGLLILIVIVFPNNVMGIILGLPFVLFFPGYVLLVTLFLKMMRNIPPKRIFTPRHKEVHLEVEFLLHNNDLAAPYMA